MEDRIVVKGLAEFEKKLADYPAAQKKALKDAATLVGDVVLDTEGLRKYPPLTAANEPPVPYYIRGRGTQTAHGNRKNSERLGTKFYSLGEVNSLGGAVVRIGSPVSYAPHIIGNDQARAMARIGWRKLSGVAREKVSEIGKVFGQVIASTLKRIGL